MIIYPAIDIRNGKCVRLVQGKAENETIYGEDPVEIAKMWENAGASFLHVVDLDGAFEGDAGNKDIIKKIAGNSSIPIQVGGGIRTMERIEEYLELPQIARVIIGTAAITNPDLLSRALSKYGKKIAVGIDAINGKVAIQGWVKSTEIDAVSFGKHLKNIGVDTVIYTDISRDGMLSGPNLQYTKKLIAQSGLDVIASGGISSIDDVINIKRIGAAGAIIGKALYTGNIELKEVLTTMEEVK